MQLSVGILAYVKNTSGASASFTAEIVPQTNANMYVYVKSASSDNATITADGFSKTFDTDDGYIIDLGERTPEETVYVDVPITMTQHLCLRQRLRAERNCFCMR